MLFSGLPTQVMSAMLNDPRTRDTTHAIRVDSDQGIIMLRGNVPTEEARQVAEEIARETEGVVYVRNELKVERP